MVEFVVLSAGVVGVVAQILSRDPGALLEIVTDVRAFALVPARIQAGLRVNMGEIERSAPPVIT